MKKMEGGLRKKRSQSFSEITPMLMKLERNTVAAHQRDTILKSNDPLCGVRLTSTESGGHEQNVISVFRRQPNCSTSLLGTGCAPMTVDDCEKLVNSSFGTCK